MGGRRALDRPARPDAGGAAGGERRSSCIRRALDAARSPTDAARATADARVARRLRLRRPARRRSWPARGPASSTRRSTSCSRPEVALSVRKTPPGGEPFDLEPVEDACDARGSSVGGPDRPPLRRRGRRALPATPLDALNDESDEIEDGIESWPGEQTAGGCRSCVANVLTVRRMLDADARRRAPRRRRPRRRRRECCVFDRSLELDFADAYDRLLRAAESLDIARELIATRATTTRRRSPRTRTRS